MVCFVDKQVGSRSSLARVGWLCKRVILRHVLNTVTSCCIIDNLFPLVSAAAARNARYDNDRVLVTFQRPRVTHASLRTARRWTICENGPQLAAREPAGRAWFCTGQRRADRRTGLSTRRGGVAASRLEHCRPGRTPSSRWIGPSRQRSRGGAT